VSRNTITVSDPTLPCVLTATRAGDAQFLDSDTSAAFTVALAKSPQTAPLAINGPITLASGQTQQVSFTQGQAGSNGINSIYTYSAGASTGCAVDASGNVTVTDSNGTCVLTATSTGGDLYTPETSVPFTVALSATPLTETGTATIDASNPGQVSASGGAGAGAISFSASAGCAVDAAGVVTVTNASFGTCDVTATKAADGNAPVQTAKVTFTLQLATQSALQIVNFSTTAFVGQKVQIQTLGGNGTGAITFQVVPTGNGAQCSISGNTLIAASTGSCYVVGIKAGDNNWAAGITSPQELFNVVAAPAV
jgi:hypothetical protein